MVPTAQAPPDVPISRLRRTRILVTALATAAALGGGLAGDQWRRPTMAPSGAPAAAPGTAGGASGTGGPPDGAAPASPAGWGEAVRAENARPGTANWRIGSTAGKQAGLEAYADRVSVRSGESVGLYIDGTGPVTVRALRMGDYGGVGARQVWSGQLTATRQPARTTDEGAVPDAGGIRKTHLVVAPWHRNGLVGTSGWPEGHYLLRLDAGPAARYVPLTVRSADARGRLLVVTAPMTWQAYNHWGGGSLYDGDDGAFADRSRAVSFDRPYLDGYGSGRFMTYDEPIVTLAERAALPLAWATDYDVAADPGLVRGASGIVIGGHAEYWTAPMRDAVTEAVASGSNLAVFGANTAYWRVRLAGRQTGLPGAPDRRDGAPRIIVGAKDAHLDPLAASDPGGATARFRDPPAPRSEEALTGMRYDCFPAETSWTVVDPGWWGYAGTGVTAGEKLEGVVGPEADRIYPGATRPVPAEIVAYQPYRCGPSASTVHTGVYWVAPSGAAVFTAGTMRWPCSTEVGCTGVRGTRAAAVTSRVTTNVLAAFAEPLAGRAHPARDTVPQFALPSRVTTHAV
ncbi:MAG TPA: N,N-dimethylformamidase beta subunit family domain-containing protein [Kineosporiaceae bacterium]